MKKIVFLLFILGYFPLFVEASAPIDSIKNTELDEFIIEAPSMIRKADKDVYYINENIKARSSSTIDLIRNIQIPQLTVNEIMETITTSLGNLQIRINGREASIEQMKSVNPQNISKVEWIDNPGLKYGTSTGAVLNIIVRNPSHGGSLNLSSMEGLTTFFNNSNINLTLNNKRSQWTVGSPGSFRGNLEMYREYHDKYKLPSGNIIERTQEPLPSVFNQNIIFPSVTCNYLIPDTTNFYIGITMQGNINQKTEFKGLLSIENKNSENEKIILDDLQKYNNWAPTLNIYWEQKLKNNQNILFNGVFQYTNSRSERNYIENNLNISFNMVNIHNLINSKIYFYNLEGNYIKSWGNYGQLTAGFNYSYSSNNSLYLDYGNKDIIQKLNKIYFFTEYLVSIRKVTFTLGLGGTWNHTKTSEAESESALHFTPRFSANWRASMKSRWSLTYSNNVISPSLSQTSPVIQAIDGIQIEKGNPELHSYLQHRLRLQYGFSNNKNLNIAFIGGFNHCKNPVQTYYTWLDENILRTYSNAGYCNAVMANVGVQYEAMPSWLSFSINLDYNFTWNKGEDFSHKVGGFGQSLELNAYHWNFVLTLQYSNPGKSLWEETITRGERINMIGLAYKYKNWNFGLMMFMAFGKYSQMTHLISDKVNQKTIIRSHSIEHLPIIRVSYDINWGRQRRSAQRKLTGETEVSSTQAAGR